MNLSLKPHYKSIIVIPVGPNEPLAYVLDDLAAIKHYFGTDHKIIIDDNSRCGKGCALWERYPDIDIVLGDYAGMWARLYTNIGKAIQYACDTYTFDVLLRMDADALVIGPQPDDDAIRYFKLHPEQGLIGGYQFNYKEEPVYQGLLGWWPQNIAISWQAFNPLSWLVPFTHFYFFRQVVLRAVRMGYSIGHQINGGAYFMSHACALRLRQAGLLVHPKLAALRLTEDVLISVLAASVGFRLGTFDRGDDTPFALEWGSMPTAPQELIARKKKITHSVKSWQDMTQPQIRAIFAACRGQTFPSS